MAVGHFKLDGREYVLPQQGALTRSNANQVAAKIGSGAGDYDDLQDWNAWLMDEWRAGVGKKDAEADGFLFATADTRFKQQFTLPVAMDTRYGTRSEPFIDMLAERGAGTTITIGSGEDYTKIAMGNITAPITTDWHFFVLLQGDDNCSTVTVKVTTGSAGGTVEETKTITLNGEPGLFWHHTTFSALAGATTRWVTMEPTSGTMTIHTISSTDLNNALYDGASWTAGTNGFIAIYITAYTPDSIDLMGYGKLWAVDDTLYYDSGSEPATAYSAAATITDVLQLGGTTYVGIGDANNYVTLDDAFMSTDGGVAGRLFTLHNGYLFRAVGNDLYYSSDASTWEGPIQVAFGDYLIRGMAGLGTDMIVSTDDGLYRVAPGDVVFGVTKWGVISATNGQHMVNFQGQLYISLGESLLRFDGETLLPYGLDLDEGLPTRYAGSIVGLEATNQWLLCLIAGSELSSLWAHNGQGWHCLAVLPEGMTATSMAQSGTALNWDATEIEIGTTDGVVFKLVVPNTTRSLARVADQESALLGGGHFILSEWFHPFAWLETSWFYGSLREVLKDFESVYIDGDSIDASNYIEVYWKDDDSTEWELLGTATSPTTELRWSNYANRPSSRRIKIALGLYNSQQISTPVVTAIRIKYMPMIRDRWRWQIPIWVSNNQQMVDGDINPYNAAQMRVHLDGLTKQVPPFIFEDPEGTQYEVKIMNASQQLTRVDWMQETLSFDTQYVYNLVVEQVIADEYA